MKIRTLLIDDEPAARAELRWLLSAHPGYEVVGEAAAFGPARLRLARPDYDLVFLDIQLVGGTGFDLVPHVAPAARIIFVTAYDRFALRAFEANALDYLLKPVATERFAASLARVAGALPAPPALALRPDDVVHIAADGGSRFVPVTEICAVFSNENYSDVLLRNGDRLITRRTLRSWEDSLPATLFMRVHRQAVANLRHAQALRRDTRETGELRLAGVREPVPVSRSYLAELETRLAARR